MRLLDVVWEFRMGVETCESEKQELEMSLEGDES